MVAGVRKRIEVLEAEAQALSGQLRALVAGGQAGDGKQLPWAALEPLLRAEHPRLHASFRRGRRPWNRPPAEQRDSATADAQLVAAEGEEGGWQVAGGRGRGGGRKTTWTDLLQDWLRGDPVLVRLAEGGCRLSHTCTRRRVV